MPVAHVTRIELASDGLTSRCPHQTATHAELIVVSDVENWLGGRAEFESASKA